MKRLVLVVFVTLIMSTVYGLNIEYDFDRAIGKEGKSKGEFDYPVNITKDIYNNIYVTDWKNNRVQKFSEDGNFLIEFGNQTAPKLSSPIGIDTDSYNNVYVVDYGNSRVIKYDENGNVLLTIGKSGKGEGEFRDPRGIFVDKINSLIYVADYKNYRVQVFNLNGMFEKEIICKDKTNNKKYPPRSLAVDNAGNIYVVFSQYNMIWKMNDKGEILKKFGQKGDKPGEFNNPRYIAIDMLNNIYITDYDNHRVQIFNVEGNCIGYFGEKGAALGKFNNPEGVFVDREGTLSIVDAENNRIQIFRPAELFKYRSLARFYSLKGDSSEALVNYKKVFELDKTDVVARKIILDDMVLRLKSEQDDVSLSTLANDILSIDSTEVEAHKTLQMLNQKKLQLEKKKKVRLILVLLIVFIVIIILIMVLKPQKNTKGSSKNIKIIIW